MISPSAYYSCHREQVPVVQTLHNYRLLCVGATFYRDGQVCEECLGKRLPFQGILHSCYQHSHTRSAGIAAMAGVHHLLGTWARRIDAYIVPSAFVRRKFVDGGFPEERIFVKPNFIAPDPGCGQNRGNFALIVGRLAEEKGIMNALKAWENIRIPLKIVGSGPLDNEVEAFIRNRGLERDVGLMGWVERGDIFALMKSARFLVFPSHWYEGLPLTILEAFACGLPVIAANHGVMADVVCDGRTGLLVDPSSVDHLVEKVRWAYEHPDEMNRMGNEARKEYERMYTAEVNYKMLMDVYGRAIDAHERRTIGR